MSVEIKFRGLTSGSGIWVYGDLIQLDSDTLIVGKDMSAGQFINGPALSGSLYLPALFL